MKLKFVLTAFAFVFLTAGLVAEELRVRFQRLNEDRRTVTVRFDGKDVTFDAAKDIRFYDFLGKQIEGGFKGAARYFRPGQDVIVTTEKRDGRVFATRLKAEK